MEAAAGLAGLGFWLFLAAVVVSRIWFDARKRESQQETLRRVVESGQHLDVAVIDRMLGASGSGTGGQVHRPDRELKVAGIIVMFVAPGLLILGWFMGRFNDKIFELMIGVGFLVLIVGIGLYVAGKMTERWQRQD
jgi:hypothetical protein